VRSGELVASDESTVIAKPFLDVIVVKDSQSDRCFPDSTWTDESDWCAVFGETNDPLDQFVTSETGLRWWGRRFARCARWECKILGPSVAEVADLV